MSKTPKPIIHKRDHEHGGSDVVRIHYEDVGTSGTGGGGIQFDVSPQAGGFLEITTTTGDISLHASDAAGDINIAGESGVIISANGNNGIVLDADGNGDILLDVRTGTASVQIWLGTNYLVIDGLPTTNPGVGTQRVWNDGGTLKIA